MDDKLKKIAITNAHKILYEIGVTEENSGCITKYEIIHKNLESKIYSVINKIDSTLDW